MGCNCGGKKAAINTLGWAVDLIGMGKTFADGKTLKVFATIGEANLAVARLGLSGKVRPRAATSSDAK